MNKTDVVPSEKERILIVAVDFDGCMGHSLFTTNYKQMLKDNEGKSPQEMKEALKGVLLQSNPTLMEDIQRRSEGYDRVVVIVGSNRQSAYKDQHDGQKNKNGSCFTATEMLAEALQEKTGKPVELDPYLMFDSILGVKPGTNFRLGQQEQDKSFEEYQMAIDKKYRLAFFQMQEICARHPQASVSYVHYDDRNDIVKDTARAFQSENGQNLPPNMHDARACHYELYNPYASLQSLANKSKNEAQTNLNQFVDQEYIEQLNTALVVVNQDSELLVGIIERHQQSVAQIEERREALLTERNALKKGTPEYIRLTQQIQKLETSLEQLPKPQIQIELIKKVRAQCSDVSGGDLPNCRLTWSQFNSLVAEAEQLTNNVVNSHYLEAFPELNKEYQQSSKEMEKEAVVEFGGFTRTVEEGHQIDMTNFDQTVRECMKDSSVDRLNTYNSFVEEDKVWKQIKEIESAINNNEFQTDMIQGLSPSMLERLLDPMKKGYIEGKIDSGTFNFYLDNAVPDFNHQLSLLEHVGRERWLFKENEKVESALKSLEQEINQGSFKPEMLDDILEKIDLNQSRATRLLDSVETGFMSGKISFETFNACLDKLYSSPKDKLEALEHLFQKVNDKENSLYAPPKNRFIRFLKSLAGKENYSSVRLNHIAQLQNDYVKIVRENKDDPEVKSHVAKSEFPDFETRHAYLGINHATTCRKQLMAVYQDDFTSTMDQLFQLSAESHNPFSAEGVGGFVATRLLNAKGRLAKFNLDTVAEYIIKHPERASILLGAYRKNFEGNPTKIQQMINSADQTVLRAIEDSKLSVEALSNTEVRKHPPPSYPAPPPPVRTPVTGIESRTLPPSQPEPPGSALTTPKERRPPPPSYPAPPPPVGTPATRKESRPLPPSQAEPPGGAPTTPKERRSPPPAETYESPEVTRAMDILTKATQQRDSRHDVPPAEPPQSWAQKKGSGVDEAHDAESNPEDDKDRPPPSPDTK